METINQIKKTYDWLNTKGYGNGFHAKKYLPFIKSLKVDSVLDIGTGRGQFCNWAIQNLCDNVHGLDISIEPKPEYTNMGINFIKGVTHDIPLEDNSVDLITSFDVLEHIHPDYIEKTITEVKRVAKKYTFNRIANCPSTSHKKVVGDLHLIQKHRKDYWVKQVFEPIGEFTALINGGIFTIF